MENQRMVHASLRQLPATKRPEGGLVLCENKLTGCDVFRIMVSISLCAKKSIL